MKDFELKLIDNNTDIRTRDGVMRRLLTFCFFIPVIFILKALTLPLFISFIVLIGTLILISRFTRRLQKDWISKKDTIGVVKFQEDNLVLNQTETINLSTVNRLALTGDYFQGCSLSSRDIVHNGLYEFKIDYADKNLSFKFIAFTKEDFENLTAFIRHLYTHFDIKIVEHIGSERLNGLLLRHDRDYDEIKLLKQEFDSTNKSST